MLGRILWIIGFIPSLILGFLIPLRVTSKTLLRRELNLRGVSWRSIPDACLAELAADTLDRVRYLNKTTGYSLRTMLVEQTERNADRLVELLGLKPVEPGCFGNNDMVHVQGVMRKHGLRPAIFPYNKFADAERAS